VHRSRRVHGPDHPTTLTASTALAVALNDLQEADSARTLGEDTLHRCRRVFGPDHVITLWTAHTLTVSLDRLGEADSARTLGEDTLQRCRRAYGPDHPVTLHVLKAGNIDQPTPAHDAGTDDPSQQS
jgi:hypothetical protein